ncbi:unnamed protein product [Cylicocyclus nassatus]|uniref:C2H2-type domain-containing protein n=1 Tax=Cylicocyclus nassatus TaxID=53992 RepID=A0AA36GMW6_CYLNA|nr:unnamed protein product [Cylicocyclus nassatus]
MATKNPSTCDVCGSLFTNLRSMRTHQREKHADIYTSWTISCPLCGAEVSKHRELAVHARFTHAQDDDDYVVEKISFGTMREFKEWKALTEETNVISRVIPATYRSSSNAKITYMRCHRALKTPHVTPHKIKKAVPYCTADMKIVEDVEVINVEHCFTHIGHDPNPAMLKLEETAVQYIISLLKEGLTVRQVYRKLREKVRDAAKNRLYFTTMRDIRNIAAKCCIQPGKLHNLDRIHTIAPAHNANGDGFTLVIITPTQRDWLKRYGQRALCVDDTFNLTSYALRLATVVVADEYDRGLPAAYLLSYRMTESETAVLF